MARFMWLGILWYRPHPPPFSSLPPPWRWGCSEELSRWDPSSPFTCFCIPPPSPLWDLPVYRGHRLWGLLGQARKHANEGLAPQNWSNSGAVASVCVWIPGWFETGHFRGWTQLMKWVSTAEECQHFPASGTLQTEMEWHTKPSGVRLDFNFFEYYLKREKELKFELNACGFGIATWSRIWMSTPPRKLVVGEDR